MWCLACHWPLRNFCRMDGKMDEWMDGQINRCMGIWTDGSQKSEWMDKPVDGWMDSPVFVENYTSHTRHWRFRHDYVYKWASQVVLVIKNLPTNAGDTGDLGLIPGSGRFPGEGNCNPLQYSCLENPMDRVAWQATVHNVTQSQTWHAQYISNSKVVWWQLRLWLENPHKPNRAVFRVLDPEF